MEGKPRENIPFEIKKMIDSKGMDSEGMEGKPRKIFGSNSKVFISNGQTYTFQTLYSQKYSVQIQKFQIQKFQIQKFQIQMINFICSK